MADYYPHPEAITREQYERQSIESAQNVHDEIESRRQTHLKLLAGALAYRDEATPQKDIDGDWKLKGACLNTIGPFFARSGERPQQKAVRVNLAKSICGRCVVRKQCLEYALKNKEADGIWGGLDEEERTALRKTDA